MKPFKMRLADQAIQKKRGYIMLQTVLALILLSSIAVGFFQIYGGQFAALAATRTGNQAQQVAEMVAEDLKMRDYESFSTNQEKTGTLDSLFNETLSNQELKDWNYSWKIGPEKTYKNGSSGTGSLRIATISVNRQGDVGARATISVPLSSAGIGAAEGGGDNLPVGTILPYKGSISNIPEKWALCDGQTHSGVTTPNLSGRFLEGVTSSPGSMKSAGLPNITGKLDELWTACSGSKIITGAFSGSTQKNATLWAGSIASKHLILDFNAHNSNPIYKDDCTTVQPASYTVLYIMKIKA